MIEPYQMDLFDLDERSYVPKRIGFEHYQGGCRYHCPKCGMVVGLLNEGVWQSKREQCRNGHKMNWENVK